MDVYLVYSWYMYVYVLFPPPKKKTPLAVDDFHLRAFFSECTKAILILSTFAGHTPSGTTSKIERSSGVTRLFGMLPHITKINAEKSNLEKLRFGLCMNTWMK